MQRIAKVLQALPVLALATIVVSACDADSSSPAGPRAEASMLRDRDLMQEDRFGLPAIATVFIPTDLKDAYNQAAPSGDVANFKSLIVAKLMAFGQDAASANVLASALAPDIQPIDLSKPTGFLNGRTLSDDVITAELRLIFGSNAALNDDHVDANDKPFLATFPYLAGPHVQ
ncbi:MAG TPA: DUF4331 family protein [Gemmatimonadales bacterium]|nr:DUF4331 family protein [Gemmatimonadales bacterium]